MGYIRHRTLVVHGWSDKEVIEAYAKATSEFNAVGHGSLVSGLVGTTVNGGMSFFIAPDGSKEGWEDSDKCDKARARLLVYLRKSALCWVDLEIGGDDQNFRVLKSPEGDYR